MQKHFGAISPNIDKQMRKIYSKIFQKSES